MADAGRITEALRRSGAAGSARVSNVAVLSSLRKARSHTLRLRLSYEGSARGAPGSIILKMGDLDSEGLPSYANRHEIVFYRDVSPALSGHVVPFCFEAVEATEASAWHLLLEDLTDSHFIATEWPLPPTPMQSESMVQTLARFHAAWWDRSCLGVSVGSWRDAATLAKGLRNFAEQFARFNNRYPELIPADRRALYEGLLDNAPRLLARYHSRRHLTLIHGDAHPWNFFLPRPGSGGDVKLIDWEDWSINTATDDLAYMISMLWYPDRRRRMERPLLDLYHAELLAQGVSGYDRQALDDDYRLSVLWLITRPIHQAMINIPARVWWNNFERIMLAVDDLRCRDLLVR
ncbi:phosphotransferase [Bradyrhizobium sp. LHD-71]|uniref:phosphotransferase family protein n=1 Tax=Bradyrhizobium sp. LHD-71 TaxID=3072141 RepID=UPI00280D0D05|nr:phosphotransferase [Bradyrhizobium sp. LHD-71]MDQ8731830.1 phosphotransferase [Bradyrhizobium sp. LHD-71]